MKSQSQILKFQIRSVQVIRGFRDLVIFNFSKINRYKNIHNGFDQNFTNAIEIYTVKYHGVDFARLMGWDGDIEVEDYFGKKIIKAE